MGRPKKEGGMSATDYKRAFNEKNYDRLSPYVKRGKKDRYKAAAAAAGYSLNEFMELAMDRLAENNKRIAKNPGERIRAPHAPV